MGHDRGHDGVVKEEWYWDLNHHRAVRADQRGPADHVLGPYATKGEAENWKARVEERNDAWEEQDQEWESWGDGDRGGTTDAG